MPPLTGFTETTQGNILVDAGILYVGTPGDVETPMLIGPSVDGFTFDPGAEIREMPFDGQRSPVVGGHRITGYQSLISGTLLEVGQIHIPIFSPGVTKVSGPPVKFTPKDAGAFFVEAEYVQNLWLFQQRGVSGFVKIAMEYALCRKHSLVSKDKDEAKVAVEFLGCVLPANLGKAPYVMTFESALPVIPES